jgi:hypothetical protein
MEDVSETNLTRWKKLADYAHSKGILLGGYSLFSSRRIDDENDVVDPVTGKTGHAFLVMLLVLGVNGDLIIEIKSSNFLK